MGVFNEFEILPTFYLRIVVLCAISCTATYRESIIFCFHRDVVQMVVMIALQLTYCDRKRGCHVADIIKSIFFVNIVVFCLISMKFVTKYPIGAINNTSNSDVRKWDAVQYPCKIILNSNLEKSRSSITFVSIDSLIVLKFCTEYGSDTVVFCAKF